MKIILIYPDSLGAETEKIIIDWVQGWIDNAKNSIISSPLLYCKGMEVEYGQGR